VDLPEPHRTTTIELNRTSLRLWEWGDPADPAIVCVHGAFDHGRMWDGLAPHLAILGHHVVAPDLRGHGDSGRVVTGHVWDATALDLALLARHLGAPIGLVGHSFGGGQALFVAAMWPELVRWVVNLDGLGPPASAFDEEELDLASACADGFAALDRVTTTPPRTYPTLEEAAERRRRINTRMPEPWVVHLTRHGTAEHEGGWRWKADPMFNVGFPGTFDVATMLEQYRLVECPVLVVTGREPDAWSDLDDAEIAERVDTLRARHHSVAGAGHYVHLEQPDEVLGAMRTFFDEVVA
jgi:pimeloyl-ACP methyl ester carboxylesterase